MTIYQHLSSNVCKALLLKINLVKTTPVLSVTVSLTHTHSDIHTPYAWKCGLGI